MLCILPRHPGSSSMTATAAGTSADGPPAKKKRGSSGNPRGVIETSSGKFQGRVNYKPPGVSKGQLRGIGTFDTPEEAGQAVTAAEAKLKAEGPDAVWPEQARTNLHKRGEVRPMPNPTSTSSFTLATTRILQAPPPKRATARRWGVYSTEKSAKANLSAEDFEAWKTEHGTPAGAETDPTFGLMPSTIEEVSNEHMAAFMATSGSGEVSPAASVE
jgi:hypothetical protein